MRALLVPLLAVAGALLGCNTLADYAAPHESAYAFGPDAGVPDLGGTYARERAVTSSSGAVLAVYQDTVEIVMQAPGRVRYTRRSDDPAGGWSREMVLARIGGATLASAPARSDAALGEPGASYEYALLALAPDGALTFQPVVGPTTRGLSAAQARDAFGQTLRDGHGRNGDAAVYARVR